MHQQFWGYKVVSRDTGGEKVEYHWSRQLTDRMPDRQ
jgi:hypothetical protein